MSADSYHANLAEYFGFLSVRTINQELSKWGDGEDTTYEAVTQDGEVLCAIERYGDKWDTLEWYPAPSAVADKEQAT